MIQYNWVNVKLCNSQLTRLKSGIKNDTEVILILSLNAIGDSHDELIFWFIGLSDKCNKPSAASKNSFAPALNQPFSTPWKHQKTLRLGMVYWGKMG